MHTIPARSFAAILLVVLFTSFFLTACASDETEQAGEAGTSAEPPSEAPVQAVWHVSAAEQEHGISDTLFGLFLEDINFAVDGGLYTEQIKNRSFEYGEAAGNGGKHGWVCSNAETLRFSVTDEFPLNENNPHAALLENVGETWEGIENVGYLDGLRAEAGKEVRLSLFARSDSVSEIRGVIVNGSGERCAEVSFSGVSGDWQRFEATVVPQGDTDGSLRLRIEIPQGAALIDMVSLMPAETWHGLPIRQDIGEALSALKPSFLRFPGGCVIEGRDLESMYRWKDSIGNGLAVDINGETVVGDVSARPQGKSIWMGSKAHPYYTTHGIGFYEYFLLCEELDCLPLPVLNAGMTCQVQSPKYIVFQTGSEEFKACVQDALDLVEFCRGDESTFWGSVRIRMGHPEPFLIKYIAIGNEQWQSEYFAHYRRFAEAFQQAAKEKPALYGDIELVVANGTMSGFTVGWDYVEDFCGEDDLVTTLVDEHYYESPQWFLQNTHRYDSYDRDLQAKVFLGEYAAQSNSLQAALAEAAYMTGLERNGDVVQMACYAPLFGNSTLNQWTPDLLFFSGDGLTRSVNYYVQQLFSENRGSVLLGSSVDFSFADGSSAIHGGVGLGSWMSSVAYDDLKVVSNETGEVLYETGFDDMDGWDEHSGSWSIADGRLLQSSTGAPADQSTGDAIFFGADWTDYTLTVKAELLGGSEGFLIPIAVQDAENQIFWNLGGWGNTVSCLQIVSGGAKSGQVSGTVRNCRVEKNRVYEIKVSCEGNTLRCWLDGELYIEYTQEAIQGLYESAVLAPNGDLILKLVNPTGEAMSVETFLEGVDWTGFDKTAGVTVLAGEAAALSNKTGQPETLVPVEGTLAVDDSFPLDVPPYSLTVIRIRAN